MTTEVVMNTRERLLERLDAMSPERREAWEQVFLKELDEQAASDELLDNLTPEEVEDLKAKLQEGIDSLDRGEGTQWNLEELLAEAHRRYEAKHS